MAPIQEQPLILVLVPCRCIFLHTSGGEHMAIFRLIPYELQKLFSGRFMRIFLALLLVANAFFAYSYAKDQQKNAEYYTYIEQVYALHREDPARFLKEYRRNVTDVDEGRASPQYEYGDERYSDYQLFRDAHAVLYANDIYHEKLTLLTLQIEMQLDNIALMSGITDSYIYRYNEQLLALYSALNESVVIDCTPVEGWNSYFTYNSEFFLVIAAMTLLSVSLAVSDHKLGFPAIGSPTRHGRTTQAFAKYLVLMVVSFLLTLLFVLSSFAAVASFSGFSTAKNAVQSVTIFEFFPYDVSIMTAFLLSLAYKVLAVTVYGVILFTVCSFVKSYLFGFGTGLFVIWLSYRISILEVAIHGQWASFNLRSLYDPGKLMVRFRTVELFSRSVDLVPIILLSTALLLVLCPAAVLILSARRSPPRRFGILKLDRATLMKKVQGKLKSTRGAGWRIRTVSLSLYELFKHRWMAVLLVLMIVAKVFASQSYFEPYKSLSDDIYKDYLEELEGQYTPQKMEYLRQELESLRLIQASFNQKQQEFFAGMLSATEFEAFVKQYNAAPSKERVVERLIDQGRYLERQYAKTGVYGDFLYDTGYLQLARQGVDFLLLLLLCVMCTRFYLNEFETTQMSSPIYTIVQTTGKGRVSLAVKKLICSLSLTAAAFWIFKGIDVYFLTKNYRLPLLSGKLFSIARYTGAPAELTVLQYTLLVTLLSFVGTMLLSMVIFFLAYHVKKTVLTYAVVLTGLFVPHFVASVLDFTMLQDVDRLFSESLKASASLWTFALFFVISAGLTALFTVYSFVRVGKGGK